MSELIVSGGDPESIAAQKNVLLLSDEAAIRGFVESVINHNPAAVTDVRNGEAKVIGFLVGQVMKESKGSADPKMVQSLIRELLK